MYIIDSQSTMFTVTVMIVFGISTYCQGHPYSHDYHTINSNIRTKPATIEEYQGEEWIAENEGRRGANRNKPITTRPNNNGRYVQNWEPLTRDHMVVEENGDSIAHAAAPPEKVPLDTIPENGLPYGAIVYIATAEETCTGVFIAAKTILTVAHCIFKKDKTVVPVLIQRQKGCSNNGVNEYTAKRGGIVAHPQYNDWEYDYAIIITKEASPVYLNYQDTCKVSKYMDLVVFGYPGNDDEKCMWRSTCHLSDITEQGVLGYPCQSRSGMSGGPVFSSKTGVMFGIHTAGDNGIPPIKKNDLGILITKDMRDTLTEWIEDYGGN